MMAKACESAYRVRCSFKQATVVICACNLMMVVCISQCLILSYYVPATNLTLSYSRQIDGTDSTPRAPALNCSFLVHFSGLTIRVLLVIVVILAAPVHTLVYIEAESIWTILSS